DRRLPTLPLDVHEIIGAKLEHALKSADSTGTDDVGASPVPQPLSSSSPQRGRGVTQRPVLAARPPRSDVRRRATALLETELPGPRSAQAKPSKRSSWSMATAAVAPSAAAMTTNAPGKGMVGRRAMSPAANTPGTLVW